VPPQPGPPPYGPYPPHPYPYVPPQPQISLWRRLREDEWPPLGELLRGRRQRIHGCVWALLLFPCTWYFSLPLLACYPLARSARRKARRIFPGRGHRRIEDPEVMRVQRARAWIAAVMSLVLLVAYGKPADMEQVQTQYVLRLTITPWLLLLSAPVVVAVLFRWASPEARRAMRPRLRDAGRSALWYFGACTLVVLLAVAAGLGQRYVSATAEGWIFLIPLITFAMFVPMLWVALFVCFCTGPAVRGAFNTAEAHAALPALLTGVLVWEFAAIGLAAGGPPPGPPLIQIASLLGGPASVTAVAWWEIRRLRTRYGVQLRA
jgi:hypothetical protein